MQGYWPLIRQRVWEKSLSGRKEYVMQSTKDNTSRTTVNFRVRNIRKNIYASGKVCHVNRQEKETRSVIVVF